MYLRQPTIAQLVVASIRKGEQLDHYELYSFVVMANHVHVLIHPHVDPSRLLKSLKGATAREANILLGRTGEPFWQKESYDHWVRDHAEFERIKVYIENNPVKAGLVKAPEQYPWSSASVEKSLDAARKECVRYTLSSAYEDSPHPGELLGAGVRPRYPEAVIHGSVLTRLGVSSKLAESPSAA
jgi:REP element-mobilizing transposase RayT